MGIDEFRRVEAWLYRVPRMETTLENMKMELVRIDSRSESTPMPISNPSRVHVTGGKCDSLQDKWIEILSDCEVRRKELRNSIKLYQVQIDNFKRVMRVLEQENPQLAELVNKKYLERVKPDQIIWDTVLYVGKTKFYELRKQALTIFLECLPLSFKTRTNSEPKTA